MDKNEATDIATMLAISVVKENSKQRRKERREQERERQARLSEAAKKGAETKRLKQAQAEAERARTRETEKELSRLRDNLSLVRSQRSQFRGKYETERSLRRQAEYERDRAKSDLQFKERNLISLGRIEGRALGKEAAEKRLAQREQAKQTRLRRDGDRRYLAIVAKIGAPLPEHVGSAVKEIVSESSLREGVSEMMARERDFATPMAALLAGIAILPESARHFNERMDEHWAIPLTIPMEPCKEVIIGGGLHAAIYCAVRKAMGKPEPLVLEARARAGGAFAVSKGASFFLNSRNRPGDLSLPGQEGALNVLPGAMLQPSDLDGKEYPTNDMLAWTIRASLAMSAKVATSAKVVDVSRELGKYAVYLKNNVRVVRAERVIIATGLSLNRKDLYDKSSPLVLSFDDLMAKMDETFPLRGMRRVAVIGGGDSGKTAIEALTGQGPTTRWSPASVDWVEKIDWYGPQQLDRGNWEECNRSRYKGLGKLLPTINPDTDDYLLKPFRVQPRLRATLVSPGYNCVYVDERPYDCVIDCTGYNTRGVPLVVGGADVLPGGDAKLLDGRPSYRSYFNGYEECYVIGPAAQIPLSVQETAALEGAGAIAENATSMFRYASRTAALAASLP